MDWQDAIGMAETFTPQHVILIRVVLAAMLGGVLGFEREDRHHAAGLRTHMLIATSAALFTLLTFEIYHRSDVINQGEGSRADPIRAIEAVTAGIAFLGAGAIFRSGSRVRNLTTGAAMWLAGAIGVAVALGYYVIAVVVTVFSLVVLSLLHRASRAIGDRKADERSSD